MTTAELDLELAELRRKRRSFGLTAWLRGLRPFDRRSIREPDERDDYWIRVQHRLARSHASYLTRHDPYPSQYSVTERH